MLGVLELMPAVRIGSVLESSRAMFWNSTCERTSGSPGVGVALPAPDHPGGVLLAPLLFAGLARGGVPVDAFTQHVTKDIVQILQATIILFVAAEGFFRGTFKKFGWFK